MQSLRYVRCDVFTDKPLEGNPLAVFTDARTLQTEQMQTLAREMNLSESVFLFPPKEGGHAKIRIFTPAREIPFAGHPVLGTAFVVGAAMHVHVVVLETGKGLVPVQLEREGARIIFGWMTQPTPTFHPFEQKDLLLEALRIAPSDVTLPIDYYDNGAHHVYVRVASRSIVENVKPDISKLAEHIHCGVSVCWSEGNTAKTRMFAPYAGVAEDPATGSAAGPLAVHLFRNKLLREGDTLEIEQGTEIKRPSKLYARVHTQDGALHRVEVGGSAVTVARGEFHFANRW